MLMIIQKLPIFHHQHRVLYQYTQAISLSKECKPTLTLRSQSPISQQRRMMLHIYALKLLVTQTDQHKHTHTQIFITSLAHNPWRMTHNVYDEIWLAQRILSILFRYMFTAMNIHGNCRSSCILIDFSFVLEQTKTEQSQHKYIHRITAEYVFSSKDFSYT